MSLSRAQPLNGRSGRRILDRARNPAEITLHAARRFREDVIKFGMAATSEAAIGTSLSCGPRLDPIGDDLFTAQRAIRDLCLHAKKIYRGKNSYILRAPPWYLFYRDGAVVTVMHEQSQRRF